MSKSKILYSLGALNTILEKEKPSKVVIVTSAALADKLSWAIGEIKFSHVEVIHIPDGEKAKEWNELEKLLGGFVKEGLDRNSIVIALGGGTVGDMVGFAAAVYLRGIRYIQVPTTLVAQVDSAHGSKTGINFSNYKNQIGSFHTPLATVIDTRFLASLQDEQVVDGLGEIIKAGFIKDSSILSLLELETVQSLPRSEYLAKIIDKAIKVKLHYVSRDFNDTKERQLLNVGHTIGHAVELKYKISHGRAVIVGMLQELALTEALGYTASGTKAHLVTLLDTMNICNDQDMTADWETILHDKKIVGDRIVFPVVVKKGKAKLVTLDVAVLKKFIKTS